MYFESMTGYTGFAVHNVLTRLDALFLTDLADHRAVLARCPHCNARHPHFRASLKCALEAGDRPDWWGGALMQGANFMLVRRQGRGASRYHFRKAPCTEAKCKFYALAETKPRCFGEISLKTLDEESILSKACKAVMSGTTEPLANVKEGRRRVFKTRRIICKYSLESTTESR